MNLKNKLEEDLKTFLKSKNEMAVSVIRLVLSSVKNREIELREEAGDEEVVRVLQNQVKQRKESITAFRQGGREDLVRREEAELQFLSKYLPQQLSAEELEKVVKEVIGELKPTSSDFGKVMREVMNRAKGRADGGQVAEVVKRLLI